MPPGTSALLRRFPVMTMKLPILMSAALTLLPAVSFAQAPPAPSTPQAQTAPPSADRATTNCVPTETVPQESTVAPRGSTTGRAPEMRDESLGDRLAKSDGVLCPPPGVDPDMHAPAPGGGKMQVIPPPGSPGGDPSVRPK